MSYKQFEKDFRICVLKSWDENDMNIIETKINEIRKNCIKKFIVGLDSEFYDDTVAVLQLAVYNDETFTTGYAFIIKFYDENRNFRSKISHVLTDIFIDQNIIKVGVNINNDIVYLLDSFYKNNDDIKTTFMQSSFDIQVYYKKIANEKDVRGLLFLSKAICDLDLSDVKHKHITTSDWSVSVLSNEQLIYAFMDTIACLVMGKTIDVLHIENNTVTKLKKKKNTTEKCIKQNDNKKSKNNGNDDDNEFNDNNGTDILILENIYKKYGMNFGRFFTGLSSTKYYTNPYSNIALMFDVRINNKFERKFYSYISMDRYLDLLQKKLINIIDGTEEIPHIVCHKKESSEEEFNSKFRDLTRFNFTNDERNNVCFSCCSTKNLHKFNIVPGLILNKLTNDRKHHIKKGKYHIKSSKEGYEHLTHIMSVPMCENCYLNAQDIIVDCWNENFSGYNNIFKNMNDDDDDNNENNIDNVVQMHIELSKFLGEIKKLKKNELEIDLQKENEIKNKLNTFSQRVTLTYDEIINMSNEEYTKYYKKIVSDKKSIINALKNLKISKGIDKMKLKTNAHAIIENLIKNDKFEDFILKFKNTFVDKILHPSLAKTIN